MKLRSLGNCNAEAKVAWSAIALVVFVSWTADGFSMQAGHDEPSSPQRPTRETIPLDGPVSVQRLMENLLSGDPKIRVEAIFEAKRMGRKAAPFVPYLIDNLDNTQRVSIDALAFHAIESLGDSALEPLIAALRIKEYKGEKRRYILNLLGRIGDHRAIPALIDALGDSDEKIRYHAAQALVDIPDQRAFEPLMQHLQDSDNMVVSSAIGALGTIGDRRAVESIIPFLVKKRAWDQAGIRDSAAVALGNLGDRRAFEPLLAVYEDREYPSKEYPDRALRKKALKSLGLIKDPRAFDVLRRALKDEDVGQRVAAVWGLAGLGDARSVVLLKSILKAARPTEVWMKADNVVPVVRPSVARALISTGDDDAIDAVYEEYKASPESIELEIERGVIDSIKDFHFRTAAVDALAMSPRPRAYLKVIDILDGTDILMRCEAARVLYCSTISQALSQMDVPEYDRRKLPALDDKRVLRALMKVAESSPPSKQVSRSALKMFRETQEYAVAALRKSGNPEALKFVEKLEARGATGTNSKTNTADHPNKRPEPPGNGGPDKQQTPMDKSNKRPEPPANAGPVKQK
jgi:HEAT repeat protein